VYFVAIQNETRHIFGLLVAHLTNISNIMAEPTLTTSQKWSKFYWQNSFLILVVLAILLALAYPPLGADYLQPQVTATWIAVIFIFTLSGLSLKSRELKKAILNLKFNLFVQIFNLGIVSCIVYFVSRGLESINVLEIDLANGMVICSCLPMTVNMVRFSLWKDENAELDLKLTNPSLGRS